MLLAKYAVEDFIQQEIKRIRILAEGSISRVKGVNVRTDIIDKCDEFTLNCFSDECETGFSEEFTLKIGDKVKTKKRKTSVNKKNGLQQKKVYSVFQLPKWSGDDVVLKPHNLEGL